MKKALQLLSAAFLVTWLAGCSQQVQTGEVVMCKHCKKEISNTVSVISVPTRKAKDYSVKRSETYCQTCGDQMVAYKVSLRCKKCGKTYDSRQEMAARKTEPRDKVVSEGICTSECAHLAKCERCGNTYSAADTTDSLTRHGFCSVQCERAEKFDRTVDKVSEKTGDILGRTVKGLLDGIKKHAK